MKKETQISKIRGIDVSTSIDEERRLFHLTAMAGTPMHVKFRSDAGEAVREVLRKRLILNGRLHSAPVSRSGRLNLKLAIPLVKHGVLTAIPSKTKFRHVEIDNLNTPGG